MEKKNLENWKLEREERGCELKIFIYVDKERQRDKVVVLDKHKEREAERLRDRQTDRLTYI